MNYWIIVASKDHVIAGQQGGFCQACHGKKWPLKKMSSGDGVLFYSSKETFGSSTPYQKFTAIGRVKGDNIYRVPMGADFQPYRRDIKFIDCREAKIHPLLTELHFVENPQKWGYKLMNGFLKIDRHDFELISANMTK
ncbi:EVE domain-containing protein [Fodinibius halophilus]|uniref:UPF0310 protein G3569_14165 n=1 Tax=Fodinibius halophilus TaxID=1736908 RepID=A0A6M1T5Z6_9BACT|nr:EVE domain-containing protein [Fodinibius halophilus]NGP89499.1 EVE domain-containing protein [Fodinibius halophilus]